MPRQPEGPASSMRTSPPLDGPGQPGEPGAPQEKIHLALGVDHHRHHDHQQTYIGKPYTGHRPRHDGSCRRLTCVRSRGVRAGKAGDAPGEATA